MRATLFAGPDDEHRASAGQVTLRSDEFVALARLMLVPDLYAQAQVAAAAVENVRRHLYPHRGDGELLTEQARTEVRLHFALGHPDPRVEDARRLGWLDDLEVPGLLSPRAVVG